MKEAMEKHPKTRAPLTEWTFKIKSASLKNPHELRKLDNSVDVIKGKGEHDLYIFNIKEFRLIVGINFSKDCVYVKHFFTHAEYDKWCN